MAPTNHFLQNEKIWVKLGPLETSRKKFNVACFSSQRFSLNLRTLLFSSNYSGSFTKVLKSASAWINIRVQSACLGASLIVADKINNSLIFNNSKNGVQISKKPTFLTFWFSCTQKLAFNFRIKPSGITLSWMPKSHWGWSFLLWLSINNFLSIHCFMCLNFISHYFAESVAVKSKHCLNKHCCGIRIFSCCKCLWMKTSKK